MIERRQRRSTTIAAQALEARALLALGHMRTPAKWRTHSNWHSSYPRHPGAVANAASVLADVDDFAAAEEVL